METDELCGHGTNFFIWMSCRSWTKLLEKTVEVYNISSPEPYIIIILMTSNKSIPLSPQEVFNGSKFKINDSSNVMEIGIICMHFFCFICLAYHNSKLFFFLFSTYYCTIQLVYLIQIYILNNNNFTNKKFTTQKYKRVFFFLFRELTTINFK